MSKISKAIAGALSSLIAVAVALGMNVPEAFTDAGTVNTIVTAVVAALGAFGVTWLAPKNSD